MTDYINVLEDDAILYSDVACVEDCDQPELL